VGRSPVGRSLAVDPDRSTGQSGCVGSLGRRGLGPRDRDGGGRGLSARVSSPLWVRFNRSRSKPAVGPSGGLTRDYGGAVARFPGTAQAVPAAAQRDGSIKGVGETSSSTVRRSPRSRPIEPSLENLHRGGVIVFTNNSAISPALPLGWTIPRRGSSLGFGPRRSTVMENAGPIEHAADSHLLTVSSFTPRTTPSAITL
jgi:hypothetical protein